jgi:hypothetical protein
MDLNQLLFHHQVALMQSDDADVRTPLGSRFDMILHYERRIAKLRREMGTTQYPAWPATSWAAA